MFEALAGRKLAVSLHQPLGDTVDVTDSRRRAPRLLSQGAGGQIGGSERRSGFAESLNARKQSLTMCTIRGGLERNIWSGSGLPCSMCTYTHTDQSFDIRGFQTKCLSNCSLSGLYILRGPFSFNQKCIFCLSQSDKTHACCKNAHSLPLYFSVTPSS